MANLDKRTEEEKNLARHLAKVCQNSLREPEGKNANYCQFVAERGQPSKTRLKSIIFPQRYKCTTRTEKVSKIAQGYANLAFYKLTKTKVKN